MFIRKVIVNDKMQTNYEYTLTKPPGLDFHANFKPELTPREMLALGIFGGKYMTDCTNEFPKDWFKFAKLSEVRDNSLNYFNVHCTEPLSVWQEKGLIYHEDPRGWFQWYCRYYLGRRCPDDERQIKRWIKARKYIKEITDHCRKGDISCRPKERQILLQWAYDSRKI